MLERFKTAQDSSDSGFASALHEIQTGGKRSHWIWYIFPQLAGLGTSSAAQFFAIHNQDEAIEFLRDAELRSRLLTMATAVWVQLQAGKTTSLHALMGSDTDARKVVSSLTLFGRVARKLAENEDNEGGKADDGSNTYGAYGKLAKVADEVLAVAASEGYPPCAHTLRRIEGGV